MHRDDNDRDPTAQGDADQGGAHAVWEAIKAHQSHVEEVLPCGDAGEIKRLYIELGDLLEQAIGSNADSAPALSFPETGPVVAASATRIKGRVLDAGCGPNPVLSILLGADSERSMVGLDIGLGTVRLATKKAAAAGAKLLGVVGDLEALPFLDRSFEGSVCEDTIEHLPNDRGGLRELARVLKPDGLLVLATPNWHRLDVTRQRLRNALRHPRVPPEAYYAASSHLREYTWRRLENLTRDSFVTRGRASVGWSGGWKSRIASRLVQRWPFRMFGRMVVLVLEPRTDRE